MTKPTVLVIGATGFIGGHLAERLYAEGHSLRVYVRSPARLRLGTLPQANVFQGDLSDRDALMQVLRGCDVVVNCAGMSTDWGADATFHAANIAGMETLLATMAQVAPEAHLLHLSTTDVYGYPAVPCDESGPLKEVGLPYNKSKIAGDRLVQAFMKDGHAATILRPVTVWGPRSSEWVIEIAKLLLRREMVTLNGGKSGAGLIYIDNLIEIIMQLMGQPRAIGRILNVRDVETVSWHRYVSELAALLGPAQTGWRDLPGGVAHVAAWLMEQAWRAAGARTRPLLTRHAVAILRRDQNYANEALMELIDENRLKSFAEAMRETGEWLASEGVAQCLPDA